MICGFCALFSEELLRFAIFCAFSINAKGGCAKHEQGKSGLVKRCWPKSAISRKDLLHLNQKLMINTKFTKYHCLDCSNFWPCTLMCTVPTGKIEVRKNHTQHCFAFQPVASSRVKKMPVKAKRVSNWDPPCAIFHHPDYREIQYCNVLGNGWSLYFYPSELVFNEIYSAAQSELQSTHKSFFFSESEVLLQSFLII